MTPRIQYNQKLTDKWFAEQGIPSDFPKVSSQVAVADLNRSKLHKGAYNCSICKAGEKIYLAYRYHQDNSHKTRLSMAELDKNFIVLGNKEIALAGFSTEDPRLFLFRGRLHISWVESSWNQEKAISVVKYAELKDAGKNWTVLNTIQPKCGKNDGTAQEKNWPFFQLGSHVAFIYRNNPLQIVSLTGELSNGYINSNSATWHWGEIKGGTAPITYKGKWLRFFHSTLDNEPFQHNRRYYLGAYLMEPKGEYKITSISSKPIVYGSVFDDLTQTEKLGCFHRKPKVVFPCGAMAGNGVIHVSVGINDCECAILNLKESDLNL